MEPLSKELKNFFEQCKNCVKCQSECEFLKRYGTPKEIVDAFLNAEIDGTVAFKCSLCQLCTNECPFGLDPAGIFLEIRRHVQARNRRPFKEHKRIIAYERLGTSKRFTWYGLPESCDTIFFPGCTLPGTRPSTTLKLFELLQKQIPSMGIVLDCCTKPSHDLGRASFFNEVFGEMRSFLLGNNIRHVLVACPNCYKVFKMYGKELSVRTVYEYLSEINLPLRSSSNQPVTVHDSCVMRFEKDTCNSVRRLISMQGMKVREMEHSGENTLCCGEGGAANFLSPDLAEKWCTLRKREAADDLVVTYCAGCTNRLGRYIPAAHILDLMFAPESAGKGNLKGAKPPFTYLNRLKLKRRLKKMVDANVTRERVSAKKAGHKQF